MADGQNIQDISEINRALAENYIHYDHNRTDYSINSFELEALGEAGDSIWKDICLCSYGIGIPCLINFFVKYEENGFQNPECFFNLLFAGLGLCIGTICLIVWRKNARRFSNLLQSIKNKPKFRLPKSQ